MRDDPSPKGRVAERSSAGWGILETERSRLFGHFPPPDRLTSFGGHPLQPKSDLSDLGQAMVPNSGKPEFGRGGMTAFVAR
jgi:hypothetical protein